jgi:nitrogen fixation-related uncharacterized protein
MSVVRDFTNLFLMVGGSLILVVLGLLYFVLTLWIVKIGAKFVGYENLDGNWLVLAASIIATGSIVSSSLRR